MLSQIEIEEQVSRLSEASGIQFDEKELKIFGIKRERKFLDVFSGKNPSVEYFLRMFYDLTADAYNLRGVHSVFIQVYATTDFSKLLRYRDAEREEVAERIIANFNFDKVVFFTSSFIRPFNVYAKHRAQHGNTIFYPSFPL